MTSSASNTLFISKFLNYMSEDHHDNLSSTSSENHLNCCTDINSRFYESLTESERMRLDYSSQNMDSSIVDDFFSDMTDRDDITTLASQSDNSSTSSSSSSSTSSSSSACATGNLEFIEPRHGKEEKESEDQLVPNIACITDTLLDALNVYNSSEVKSNERTFITERDLLNLSRPVIFDKKTNRNLDDFISYDREKNNGTITSLTTHPFFSSIPDKIQYNFKFNSACAVPLTDLYNNINVNTNRIRWVDYTDVWKSVTAGNENESILVSSNHWSLPESMQPPTIYDNLPMTTSEYKKLKHQKEMKDDEIQFFNSDDDILFETMEQNKMNRKPRNFITALTDGSNLPKIQYITSDQMMKNLICLEPLENYKKKDKNQKRKKEPYHSDQLQPHFIEYSLITDLLLSLKFVESNSSTTPEEKLRKITERRDVLNNVIKTADEVQEKILTTHFHEQAYPYDNKNNYAPIFNKEEPEIYYSKLLRLQNENDENHLSRSEIKRKSTFKYLFFSTFGHQHLSSFHSKHITSSNRLQLFLKTAYKLKVSTIGFTSLLVDYGRRTSILYSPSTNKFVTSRNMLIKHVDKDGYIINNFLSLDNFKDQQQQQQQQQQHIQHQSSVQQTKEKQEKSNISEDNTGNDEKKSVSATSDDDDQTSTRFSYVDFFWLPNLLFYLKITKTRILSDRRTILSNENDSKQSLSIKHLTTIINSEDACGDSDSESLFDSDPFDNDYENVLYYPESSTTINREHDSFIKLDNDDDDDDDGDSREIPIILSSPRSKNFYEEVAEADKMNQLFFSTPETNMIDDADEIVSIGRPLKIKNPKRQRKISFRQLSALCLILVKRLTTIQSQNKHLFIIKRIINLIRSRAKTQIGCNMVLLMMIRNKQLMSQYLSRDQYSKAEKRFQRKINRLLLLSKYVSDRSTHTSEIKSIINCQNNVKWLTGLLLKSVIVWTKTHINRTLILLIINSTIDRSQQHRPSKNKKNAQISYTTMISTNNQRNEQQPIKCHVKDYSEIFSSINNLNKRMLVVNVCNLYGICVDPHLLRILKNKHNQYSTNIKNRFNHCDGCRYLTKLRIPHILVGLLFQAP